jgi:hypothetical protein
VRLVRTQADGDGGPGLPDEDVRAVVARIARRP